MILNKTWYFRCAFLFLLILALVLAACSVDSPPAESTINPSPNPVLDSTQTTPPSTSETPEPTRLPVQPTISPQQTEQDPGPISYQLDANLDYSRQFLEVKQKLEIPHPGSVPLEELVLMIPANDWPGVLQIQRLIWENGAEISEYSLERVALTIPLHETWAPGTSLEIILEYSLALPVQNARAGYGPSPFGYTQLQTNLVDWYAIVPPYQEGKGWLVHEPWLFGEYLVYPAADFKVSLQISNGPEVIVAASGPAVQDGMVRTYRLQQARNFVLSISPSYQVFEGKVGETTVLGYHFPGYTNSGQAAFQTTTEALELYQELYGPYQQETLSMIQADFNHGMEYEGLFYLSKAMFDVYNNSPRSYLIAIAAHETAHQWWYGKVANDQALEPWLDESLCTFSELVYYENLHPEAVDWWREARIDFYQPEGPIDGAIYDFTVPGGNNYEDYRQAVYLRGAEFQGQLREELGQERYYQFLRDYAGDKTNQVADGEDFFNLLGQYTEVEKLPWLGEYFESKQ
jgi:hypothetical protein